MSVKKWKLLRYYFAQNKVKYRKNLKFVKIW